MLMTNLKSLDQVNIKEHKYVSKYENQQIK